jgi:hypothetical protein
MTNDPRPLVGDGELPVQPVAWACTDYDGRVGVGITQADAKLRAGEHCKEFFPLYAAIVGQPAPDLAAVLEALEIGREYVPSTPGGRLDEAKIDAAITSLRASMGMPE